jgi:hypothetical protein
MANEQPTAENQGEARRAKAITRVYLGTVQVTIGPTPPHGPVGRSCTAPACAREKAQRYVLTLHGRGGMIGPRQVG